MSRNNDVSQVLVTTGDQAIAAKDAAMSALLVGQIGVFDAETRLAVDATNIADSKEIFLAVGVDSTGDAAVDTYRFSAGQSIQVKNIRYYEEKDYVAPLPMIVTVSDYLGAADTEFAIKLEFRNQEIYRRQGYNQFSYTYSVKTQCNGAGDANEVSTLLRDEILQNENALVVPVIVARQAIVSATIDAATTTYNMDTTDPAEGDPLTDGDILALLEYNALQSTDADRFFSDLQLTTVPTAINAFCNINTKYYRTRSTVTIVSLIEGFACNNGVVVEDQAAVFEQGKGYDIQQKEYHASGWNGKPGPYKVNSATGLAKNDFQYLAVSATNYDQIALTYDHFSVAGWQEHLNNTATVIAIPTGGSTTKAELIAALAPIV